MWEVVSLVLFHLNQSLYCCDLSQIVLDQFMALNSDVTQPSMVIHTRNLCSAFNPSKARTRTQTRTRTRTHTEQLGVRCLAQAQLSRGIEGGESAGHSLPPPTIPAGPRLELTTFILHDRLTIKPRLPLKVLHILCKKKISGEDCFSSACLMALLETLLLPIINIGWMKQANLNQKINVNIFLKAYQARWSHKWEIWSHIWEILHGESRGAGTVKKKFKKKYRLNLL